MFRRNKRVKPDFPLTGCSLSRLAFDVTYEHKDVTSIVPDKNGSAYQETLRDGLGVFSPQRYAKAGGTYVEVVGSRIISSCTVGAFSCRRTDSLQVGQLRLHAEGTELSMREELSKALGKQAAAFYCGACPYRVTRNLDPLRAALYDKEVAAANAATAELIAEEAARTQVLSDLQRIGNLPLPPS